MKFFIASPLAVIRKDEQRTVSTGRDALRRVRVIIVCLCFYAVVGNAQVQQAWVARYDNGITNGTNQTVKMLLDSAGNINVTGFSENTNTNLGYVTMKIAPNGSQIWTQRFDSSNFPSATPSAMTMDSGNDVIVTGNAVTMEYDASGALLWSDALSATSVGADGGSNIYITGVSGSFETIKLSPEGSNIWTAVETGLYSGPTSGLAISVDNAGEAFVAGDEPFVPQNLSYQECLTIVKYSVAGNVLWRDRLCSNNIYAIGSSIGVSAFTLDNQTNVYLELGYSAPNPTPYWTLKFDSSGDLAWILQDPTDDLYSRCYSIALDKVDNVIITGLNAYDYPNGSFGTYKIVSNGSYIWTNLYPQVVKNVSAGLSVATDSANNVYVTGYSPGTNGFNDIVTIKYNANGGQVWLERYSSPVPGNAAGNAIAVDASGNVYVAGYDTGLGGGTEMVVIKYSPITLQVLSNGTVQLQAQGAAGELFDVQATSDLQNWQDLGQSAADTNGLFQFDDTNAPQYPARFYTTIPQ